MLATGGKLLHLWSLPSYSRFGEVNPAKPPINDICFTYDGRQILLGGECEVLTRIDLYTGEKQSIGTNLPRISRIACSSDGHFVAVGSKSGPIAIFGEQRQISRAHRVAVTALAYANDCTTLIAGDKNGLISMGTNKRTKLPNWSATRYGSVYDISVARHSDVIAISCKAGLIIYDLVQTGIIGAQKLKAKSLCHSPFSDNLIAIVGNGNEVLFYDPSSNMVVNTVQFGQPVTSLDFRFDGVTVGAAVQNEGVKLLDIRQLDRMYDLVCDDETSCIRFQPKLIDDPVSKALVTLQSQEPVLAGWPRPLTPRKDLSISSKEPVGQHESAEEEELDLDKIRTEIQEIEQDIVAHEPTLSPRNAAFLKAARELKAKNRTNVFALTEFESTKFTPKEKKQSAKPETTDETKEMIRIITEAYATAMEDMQDEMNQAMNNVHLDILKRTAELKKVIDDLQ